MTETVLWSYPKSSASYRVRIALNLAKISYRVENVNLLDGAQRADEHLARNPQGLVPVLEIDGMRLTQSLAIIEYLDETRGLSLLPDTPVDRARAKAPTHCIAMEIAPVCNLSVAAYATGGKDPARTEWMQHFIRPGLLAFETLLKAFEQAPFAAGTAPGLADICLIPQLYNARRWGAEYGDCPRIKAIEEACARHPAFVSAAP